MRDHLCIVVNHYKSRKNRNNGRRNREEFVIKSVGVTNIPNCIEKENSCNLQNQHIMLRPRLIENLPNVVLIFDVKMNIECRSQPRP